MTSWLLKKKITTLNIIEIKWHEEKLSHEHQGVI